MSSAQHHRGRLFEALCPTNEFSFVASDFTAVARVDQGREAIESLHNHYHRHVHHHHYNLHLDCDWIPVISLIAIMFILLFVMVMVILESV